MESPDPTLSSLCTSYPLVSSEGPPPPDLISFYLIFARTLGNEGTTLGQEGVDGFYVGVLTRDLYGSGKEVDGRYGRRVSKRAYPTEGSSKPRDARTVTVGRDLWKDCRRRVRLSER